MDRSSLPVALLLLQLKKIADDEVQKKCRSPSTPPASPKTVVTNCVSPLHASSCWDFQSSEVDDGIPSCCGEASSVEAKSSRPTNTPSKNSRCRAVSTDFTTPSTTTRTEEPELTNSKPESTRMITTFIASSTRHFTSRPPLPLLPLGSPLPIPPSLTAPDQNKSFLGVVTPTPAALVAGKPASTAAPPGLGSTDGKVVLSSNGGGGGDRHDGDGEGDNILESSFMEYYVGRRVAAEKRIKGVLRKKFSWKCYPELEAYLVQHRRRYLHYSSQLNYTAEQKRYNNQLTQGLLDLAAEEGYVFDGFTFAALRDRIRCYYKSYVQAVKKKTKTKKKKQRSNSCADDKISNN